MDLLVHGDAGLFFESKTCSLGALPGPKDEATAYGTPMLAIDLDLYKIRLQ